MMPGPYYTLEDLNYPYGAPSPDSRAGRIPGEISNSPSTMEQIGAFAQPVYEYGSMPAKGYVGLFDEAGGALARFAERPNFPDLSEAGVKTLMAAGMPISSMLAAAGSYGGGIAYDTLKPSKARAVDQDALAAKLKAMSRDEIKALQRELGITADGVAGPGTLGAYTRAERAREDAARNNAEVQAAVAGAKAKAAGEAEVAKERARLEAEAALKTQRNERVDAAKKALMEDLLRARTPTEDTSVTGEIYKRLGGMTPFFGAMAGGMAARAAPNVMRTGYKLVDDYLNPMLAGAEVGGSMTFIPLSAEANRPDPTNPQRRAWENYRARLPAEAEAEIARADERLSDVTGMPLIDPSVQIARDTLGSLKQRGIAMGGGALAGLSGNLTAAAIGEMPAILGAIPGKFARGYREGFKGAAKPRNTSKSSPLGDAADRVEGMGKKTAGSSNNLDVYKSYAAAPPEIKDQLYQRVASDILFGRASKAADLKAEMAAKGVQVPITQKRIDETRRRLEQASVQDLMGGSIRGKATLGLGGAFAAGSMLDDKDY